MENPEKYIGHLAYAPGGVKAHIVRVSYKTVFLSNGKCYHKDKVFLVSS